MVAHAAGASDPRVAGAAVTFAAWLLVSSVPIARLGDRLGRAAAAGLLATRARRLDRKLAAHAAARRRRREYVEVESAVDLAALAVGLAEGRAAVAAGASTPALEGARTHVQ
jgi:hypothetical protein